MTDTLDYDLIRRWEAALRSGRYNQGVSLLKYEDKSETVRYCCLGVLCEVGGLVARSCDHFAIYPRYEFDGSTLSPPKALVESFAGKHISDHADLTLDLPPNIQELVDDVLEATPIGDDPIARQCGSNGEYTAATLNDTFNLSFSQIADCIRFTWPEAFAE